MLCHGRETLVHPLTNGYARHHDNEFRPTIVFVELIHRLDVGIGFARTRLHLHREVYARALKPVDRFKSLLYLQGTHILCDVAALERQRSVAKSLLHLALEQSLAVWLFSLVFDVD